MKSSSSLASLASSSSASSAHSNQKNKYFGGVLLNDILFSSRSRKKPDYYVTNYEEKNGVKKSSGRKRHREERRYLPPKSRNSTQQEMRTEKCIDYGGHSSPSPSAVCNENNRVTSERGDCLSVDGVASDEDLTWEKNFKHLKELHDTNDPIKGIIFIKSSSPLSSWILWQRKGMKRRERGKCTSLKDRGFALLDSIHFDWGFGIRHKKSNKWKYEFCDDKKGLHVNREQAMRSRSASRKRTLLSDSEGSLDDVFVPTKGKGQRRHARVRKSYRYPVSSLEDISIPPSFNSKEKLGKTISHNTGKKILVKRVNGPDDDVDTDESPTRMTTSKGEAEPNQVYNSRRNKRCVIEAKYQSKVAKCVKRRAKGKTMAYSWMCQKCEKAVFATLEQACKHEHSCKGPKDFRWLCSKCESAEFQSFEECAKHENKCSGGLMREGRGTWLCGRCKAAKFLSYEDACAHEASCKLNVSVMS